MSKIQHVLGISGGKDSAALAIYLKDKYPQFNFTYYFTDTGKELDETYTLIENLEGYLGAKINKLEDEGIKNSGEDPFDFFFKSYRGYLPSPQARWCTAMMKLKPFEKFVGDKPTMSYVGIRGDEQREGYISRQDNIQSIFPFRKNIWSQDVLRKIFDPKNQEQLLGYYSDFYSGNKLDKIVNEFSKPISFNLNYKLQTERIINEKLDGLLNVGIIEFNKSVFKFLKTTNYPISFEEDYPLLENEDNLVRADIFRLLEESGVGIPAYYNKVAYEVDGQKGEYARSRSGCYFCFFQQKIEWIWLYEQHPELFKKAMTYENEDELFTWIQNESLKELINPERIKQIKLDHIKRTGKEKSQGSKLLMDKLIDAEDGACTACFI
ncbi:phosphoadenosine phosphosulfate reductase family protein [Tenacibaculum singaporense]|uniref:Phosphoadenosine phosphosulfate reductase n=1 Tax=Tenacibaculum singaporense TaxID=2358479 RepID=A0A3Q8RNT3_9FLAO|nr:phosphoadenosine phosphosulfate reductase family protein [Tenacibaculum singaporense]AZJ35807.1 phosphoadenosine phosphosulfate reductase [Tenacibaculum singaporense]